MNKDLTAKHILPIEIHSASFKNNTPNQGGYEEFMTLNIRNYNLDKENTISIKIRAIDAHKNLASWSPILTLKLNKQVKLSSNLKHYENNVLQHLKIDKEGEEKNTDSIYWELFVFLIGKF